MNREEPRLESAAEGTGSCGIVVQGPRGETHLRRSQTNHTGPCDRGGRTSRIGLYARVWGRRSPRTPRVAQFDSAVQSRRCTSAKAKYRTKTDSEQVV